jgi:integrase
MPTLAEALLTFCKLDRSPKTNEQYRLVLTRLAADIGPRRDVNLVRYEDLVDYFDQQRTRGLKQSTLNGYLAVHKTFFTWCVQRSYSERSPAADLRLRKPPRDPDAIKPIPPEDLRKIIELARWSSPRNHAILMFLADTGCRVTGLVSLLLSNLDLDDGHAFIVEKGGDMVRVLFSPPTAEAIQRWLKYRPSCSHDYVWTATRPGSDWPALQESGVADAIRRLCVKAELAEIWGPHAIRHAVGVAWAKSGAPVTLTQRKLNHKHSSTTMDYYYPFADEELLKYSKRNALAALKDDDSDLPQIRPKPKSSKKVN